MISLEWYHVAFMKKISSVERSVVLILCVAMILGSFPGFAIYPVHASSDIAATAVTTTGYDRGYEGGMAGDGEYKAFGLDVSSWQGSSLSFTRIKNAGYDYVILRAGTTNGKDTCFETYYANAKAAGLDVGAYYYSYATTVSAVKTDMEDFLSYISGKTFEYPIYFDYEDASQQELSASLSEQICLTAMDMLAAEGYLVGMYTGKYFSTLLPMDTICAKYEAWIAHYLATGGNGYDGTDDYTKYGPTYSTQYGMYQFTDSVWIDGYGPYDGDVCYKDYPSIVKKYGFNGYEPELTYMDACTFYPSHCSFTTTEDTSVFSEPRAGIVLETAVSGTTYTSIGLYVNTDGDIYYEVELSDGSTGYIYSGDTGFGKKDHSDIKLKNASLPNGHVKGNVFYVTGTISSTYNRLGKANVYIYQGFGVSGDPVTGGTASVSNDKYVLDGSAIDNATSFGSLSTGKYTYLISVTYTSYYAKGPQELGTISSTRNLKKHYFTVIDSAVDQTTCEHDDSVTVVKAATCTDTGTNVTSCSICGLTEKATVEMLGHAYETITVPPTCTEDGSTVVTCANCGESSTQVLEALGHDSPESTCTEAAVCTVCGETVSGALGHDYIPEVKAPTCTTAGYTVYTCSTCQDLYIGDTVLARGHSYLGGFCTECEALDPDYVPEFYLFGIINGENYGYEENCEEVGIYRFNGSSLVVRFETDSYVGVKTGDNIGWYMARSAVTGTSATLYDTSTGASEMMFVPGGVEITFLLLRNSDGSLDLSYVASETVQPTLTLKYPSLSFESDILYNVYYIAENTDDVVEMGLATFATELTDGTVETATDVIPGFETDGSIWKVSSNGISAKNLGDTLYFKVYAVLSDGSYVYTDMKSYSAVSYANTILKRTTSSSYMKSLVVAMLNYGAEAQLYFGHNTDSLMNAGLTAEQQALVSAYDESMVDPVVTVDSTKAGSMVYDGSSYVRRAPSVSFDGAFSINYYFTTANVPDGDVKLYYWTIEDYNAATTLKPSNASGCIIMKATDTTNQYWGQVSGIAAKELDETVFVAGFYYYGDKAYSTGVLNYSIGKYCEGIAAKDTSAQQGLAQATAVYGYYAKEYFANL